MFQIKRIYEKLDKEDGFRVLVDRIWPRGVSKEEAKIDLWLKDMAPSTELRKWFSHDPERWNGFQRKYTQELQSRTELIIRLLALGQTHKTVTLLYSARDTDHNQAVVLMGFLKKQFKKH